jgi:Uma2 family endonuclease
MSIQTHPITRDEFERLAVLPENANRHLEFLEGELIEMVSNSRSSMLAYQIGSEIGVFVRQHKLGFVSGEAGGYRVNGQDFMPDVGFISKEKFPTMPSHTWVPEPPELAVEVLSPTDSATVVNQKVRHYLAAGTVVWLVDPDAKTVTVYRPGDPYATRQTLGIEDTLDGGAVLPGFAMSLSDLFDDTP